MIFRRIFADQIDVKCEHCGVTHSFLHLEGRIVRVQLDVSMGTCGTYFILLRCDMCNTEFGLKMQAYFNEDDDPCAQLKSFRWAVLQISTTGSDLS